LKLHRLVTELEQQLSAAAGPTGVPLS
jgi:hypothetical protein